jgi:hypothetical protein
LHLAIRHTPAFAQTQCLPPRIAWHSSSLTITMLLLLTITPMFAAAGWAFLYLLCGGGLGGAFLIFIVLKMLGR